MLSGGRNEPLPDMKLFFAVFPISGHVNPGLPIARELVNRGHDVRWYSTPQYKNAIERIGARFVPHRRAYAFDDKKLDLLPGRPRSGLKQLQWDVEHIFIADVPNQFADIEEELRREPADAIVSDSASIVCSVVGEKLGIPFVVFGITVMSFSSRDTAPFGLAFMPSSTVGGRLRNKLLYWVNDQVIFRKAVHRYGRIRLDLGLQPLTETPFDFPKHAALYLQGSAASFEYPRSDLPANVRWIGASVPDPPPEWNPPQWWRDLDGAKVVLVTQGTINNNYDQLIRPAIRALANENLLLVVTTGSKPAEDVAVDPLPPNVRVEQFIPYVHLMPKVDLLITNGGYGTVQIALAHGVPIVIFGKTEEKPEIANRLTYCGAGLGVKVLIPTEEQIRGAVRSVLEQPSYRTRAHDIACEMNGLRGSRDAASLIEQTTGRSR